MERKTNEYIKPIFGTLNHLVDQNRLRIDDLLKKRSIEKEQDILDPNIELCLIDMLSDANTLGYVLHEEKPYGPAAQNAFRGIVFAHMTIDQLITDVHPSTFDEYWSTFRGATHEFMEHSVITEAQAYLYQNYMIADLLSDYMPFISRFKGYEHMVEISAALTFRKTEIHTAIDTEVPKLRAQLNT